MSATYALLPVVNHDKKIIIDASHYPILCRYRWYVPRGRYAGNPRPFTYVKKDGKERQLRLARIITKAPDGMYPKHINGNALDCRRENMELVSWRDDAGGWLSITFRQ